MVTYKRLGLKMARGTEGKWRVIGKDISFEASGNKGQVMSACLEQHFELRGRVWQTKEQA